MNACARSVVTGTVKQAEEDPAEHCFCRRAPAKKMPSERARSNEMEGHRMA